MKAADASSPSTAASLGQALASFERFLDGRDIAFRDLTEDLVSDWLSAMLAESYTCKTIGYYLKNLSALYGKAVSEGLARESRLFATLRHRLDELGSQSVAERASDRELVSKIRRLGEDSTPRLHHDVVLFAILAGGLSFDKLAEYKKADYQGDNEVALAIIERNASPRRKYLFPLRQSQQTPAQLRRYIAALFNTAFADIRLAESVTPDVAAHIWGRVAMDECGVSPAEAVACLGCRPQDNPAYLFARDIALDDDEKALIRERVAARLTDNPAQWFAMRLRPGVSGDRLRERLNLLPQGLSAPEIYYPSEEIARRVGRKIIREERPVVPGLVFFRTRLGDVGPLFAAIGDIAWCYRVGRGAYAVIPPAQMFVFQQTIGLIAPGTELSPIGTTPLAPGDRVEIIGGSFIGLRGIVAGEHTPKSGPSTGRTLYRLLLPDTNGIEWTVTTPQELLKRV